MHFRHPKQQLVQPKTKKEFSEIKKEFSETKNQFNKTKNYFRRKQRKKGSKPFPTHSLLISIVTYLSLPVVFPSVELQA